MTTEGYPDPEQAAALRERDLVTYTRALNYALGALEDAMHVRPDDLGGAQLPARALADLRRESVALALTNNQES